MAANSGDNLRIHGLTAQSDLSAKQYHAVILATTARKVKIASAATQQVLGILQNDPVAGEPASVVAAGMTKAYSGAAVVAGTLLTSNSTGQLITSTTANNKIVGRAITAASGTAVLFELFCAPSNY